jgi:hypothetical protein
MTNDKIKVEKIEPLECYNVSSIKTEKIEIEYDSPKITFNQSLRTVKNEPSSSTNNFKSDIKDEPCVFPKTKKAARVVCKDVCAICLSNFSNQNTGTPNVCKHQFCLDCIQEWAKVIEQV